MNNPIQMIKMMMGKKNPQQLMAEITKNNNNPMINNLVGMAEKGDNEGVQNFARNLFKEQGRDFDAEFAEFMGNFK